MADRIPLIINSAAQQIQELPNGDDLTVDGEITAVQPACLLTNVSDFTLNNAPSSLTPTNDVPIGFDTITTNVGCTVATSTSVTVSGKKSKIIVPTAGTYLISACITGIHITQGSVANDKTTFLLRKNGSVHPSQATYPAAICGKQSGEEFHFTFTIL